MVGLGLELRTSDTERSKTERVLALSFIKQTTIIWGKQMSKRVLVPNMPSPINNGPSINGQASKWAHLEGSVFETWPFISSHRLKASPAPGVFRRNLRHLSHHKNQWFRQCTGMPKNGAMDFERALKRTRAGRQAGGNTRKLPFSNFYLCFPCVAASYAELVSIRSIKELKISPGGAT